MGIDIKKYLSLSPFEVKNELIKEAQKACKEANEKGEKVKVRNAGRGNPNFLNTSVRQAFSHLELFVTQLADTYYDNEDLGKRPDKKGIAEKFFQYVDKHIQEPGVKFLKDSFHHCINEYHFDADEFVFEMADGALGDFYPMPPRIFPHIEKILTDYLAEVLSPTKKLPEGNYDLFATEGATAAMIYLFKSLKLNHIISEKDKIAIITPIFSPYLEIPHISEYNLVEILVEGREDLDWQISDKELDKLKDPKIKVLYLVNPTNPTSIALNQHTLEKIAKIVKEDRKDLIVMTDTVYALFVEDFNSIFNMIPKNSICVYSFSKYFGVTGWRLGVIMMHRDNIIDEIIEKMPDRKKKDLKKYYSMIVPDPENIKFIERLEIDSRDAALAHTGGLSCPQQALMALFSLFNLLDKEKKYKHMIHEILKVRVNNLFHNLGIEPPEEKGHTYYYTLLDFTHVAREKYGEEFAKDLSKNVLLLEYLFRLAKEKYIICLPGEGFAGPKWSLRVSLANLDDDDYIAIGRGLNEVLEDYYRKWKEKS